ncbi:MAG: PAS domain S-box protein [Pseudomonadota bacterium]
MRYATRVVLFVVLINALVLCLEALSLKSSYDQYVRTAFAATRNISDLLIEQMDEEFDAADKALLVVADEFHRQSATGRMDHKALTEHLRRHLLRNPMLSSLSVTDAKGEVLVGSDEPRPRSNFALSEQDCFVQHRKQSNAGLVISRPVRDRVSGKWGLVFSRRLNHLNGTFAGVVYGVISLDHLKASFSKLWVGPRGSIAMRDAQSGLIVRVPRLADAQAGDIGSRKTSTDFVQAIQRDPRAGVYTSGMTSIDGTPKVHVYGQLPHYPFYVNVGMAEQDFLAPWYEDLKLRALFSAVFALISMLGGWLLMEAWRRREQILKALRHSEARTRSIVHAALDGMVHLDASGTIIGWNPGAEQLFGWPTDFALGRGMEDLCFAPFDPHGGRPGLTQQLLSCESGTTPGNRFESMARHRDGRHIPIELSIAPIGSDAQREYSVFVRDLTAAKAQQATALALDQSQERFRLAMEAGQEGLWDWDVGSDGGYFSPTYYKLLGYADSEFPMTGRVWFDQLHPGDRQRMIAIVRGCIENRAQEFEAEYRMRSKDGSYQWILGRGSVVVRDAAGHAVRMIGTHQDIGTRKAAEAALLAAKTEAEAASNAKSRFLAAASHDLRQPLSAISLYTDVLLARKSPADAALLNNMSLCITSLNTLLTDLLDISRLDAGVVAPALSDFSVADMLSRLVAVHGPAARENGLQLRCRPSNWYARTDPVLMARMLSNLIANAIRYTERGGVLIACRRHQNSTWIEVWDTGIGIPSDKTDVIFEEYCQLTPNHPSRGSASIGSGLGLAIVAKSAALLGLRIRVQSRVGKGSLFAVELPLGRRTEVEQQGASSARQMRVALVEDSINVLDALRTALESRGHEVVAATSRAQLMCMLGSRAPDVVISDYRLQGGESGTDVIHAARQVFGAELPALIITGNTDPLFLGSMATLGVAVQHKPLKLDELLLKIAELTERRLEQAVAGR